MSGGKPPRLALLGCGWIACNRLRQIRQSAPVDVVALADTDDTALRAAAQWAPGADCLPHLAHLGSDYLDGVMISTPSALHAGQALAMLERGLPVFVQKPMGLDSGEVGRVLATAERLDLPVETDLCYRYLKSARALRRELGRGAVGEPYCVEAWFHNAFRPGSGWSHEPALAGGGALMDLGIHLLDLIMWTTDLPLALRRATLRAAGETRQSGQVEDFALLELTLANGADVRMIVTWDASTGQDADIGMRLFGAGGNLELKNVNGSFFDFEAWRFRGRQKELLDRDDSDCWQGGPLTAWLERLAEGGGYRRPPWVEPAMEVIDQAYAFTQGRSAVAETLAISPNRKGVLP